MKSNLVSDQPCLILIDDDPIIRASLELAAKRQKKSVLVLENYVNEFDQTISFETPLYIDLHLANEQSGIDLAQKLFLKGFKNIFITTGDPAHSIEKPAFIKEIVEKEIPARKLLEKEYGAEK